MTYASPAVLPSVELETGSAPAHTVIWLHGLGADGNDFVPVVKQLVPTLNIPPVRFLFPHAPMRPMSINRGMVMRAWYDYDLLDPGVGLRENMPSLVASQRAIEALIAREVEGGVPPQCIVLAGFSQGGALALQAGLRYPEKLAGIMALSAYLPAPTTLPAEGSRENLATSIFMAHGVNDHVVPMILAETSKRQLVELGYPLEWHEYRMAHSVCDEELADISDWLNKVLQ
jgi:phospholipase/carboxylesterase